MIVWVVDLNTRRSTVDCESGRGSSGLGDNDGACDGERCDDLSEFGREGCACCPEVLGDCRLVRDAELLLNPAFHRLSTDPNPTLWWVSCVSTGIAMFCVCNIIFAG